MRWITRRPDMWVAVDLDLLWERITEFLPPGTVTPTAASMWIDGDKGLVVFHVDAPEWDQPVGLRWEDPHVLGGRV